MEIKRLTLFAHRYRRELTLLVAMSALINATVFFGSLYMMIVYDSVIPSRSLPTLFGLFAILIVVYLLQFALETVRADAALAIANGLHDDLAEPVQLASVGMNLSAVPDQSALQLRRDLDAVHSYLSSPGPLALFDLPWVVPFLLILAALDIWLGIVAILGTAVLVAVGWWTTRLNDRAAQGAVAAAAERSEAFHAAVRFAHVARTMGFAHHLSRRALERDAVLRAGQSRATRLTTLLATGGRLFRILLQSAILTTGALLVIDLRASGGIILAASILVGRALAPVDQSIAQARAMMAAAVGWNRIMDALEEQRPPRQRAVVLNPPRERLEVIDLWAAPPGTTEPVLRGIDFTLRSGESLAIIGTSAAGKSTLAKVLVGLWQPVRGEVRYDGATADQWDEAALGSALGYVPQEIDLMAGTVAQNIGRFDPDAASADVIAAAAAVSFHERILTLPQGYGFDIGSGGMRLSVGQRQRLALARAFYADPFLLVLDEPNANLDAAGDVALAGALTQATERGAIVIIVTQRASILNVVSHIASMKDGQFARFGEREPMLKQLQAEQSSTVAQMSSLAGKGRKAGT